MAGGHVEHVMEAKGGPVGVAQVTTWNHVNDTKEVLLGVGYYRGQRTAGFGAGQVSCVRGCKCFEQNLRFTTAIKTRSDGDQRWAFLTVSATPDCIVEVRAPPPHNLPPPLSIIICQASPPVPLSILTCKRFQVVFKVTINFSRPLSIIICQPPPPASSPSSSISHLLPPPLHHYRSATSSRPLSVMTCQVASELSHRTTGLSSSGLAHLPLSHPPPSFLHDCSSCVEAPACRVDPAFCSERSLEIAGSTRNFSNLGGKCMSQRN